MYPIRNSKTFNESKNKLHAVVKPNNFFKAQQLQRRKLIVSQKRYNTYVFDDSLAFSGGVKRQR